MVGSCQGERALQASRTAADSRDAPDDRTGNLLNSPPDDGSLIRVCTRPAAGTAEGRMEVPRGTSAIAEAGPTAG